MVTFDPEIDRTYRIAARTRRQSLLDEENLDNTEDIHSDLMEDRREQNQNRLNNENQLHNGNRVDDHNEVN